jgi:HlyD family secretion protein
MALKSWFKPQRLVVVTVVCLGAGYAWWSRARGPEVGVVSPVRRAVVQTVVATGRVQVQSRAQVGSVILGTVVKVRAEEGQRVKRGELLVQLNDTELHANVDQARASAAQAEARLEQIQRLRGPAAAEDLRQAQVALTQAQAQFERRHDLLQRATITVAEFEEAQTALDLARSRYQSAVLQLDNTAGTEQRLASGAVAQAGAALAVANARLAQTLVTSPGDGVVIQRMVEPGDVVQPGKVLLVVARDGETRLLVPFDEKNLSLLAVGQTAVASADAFPDRKFSAVLDWIAPAVDGQRGTVDVRLKVEVPPPFLKPDMTVSVEVEVGRKPSALVVPAEAVRDLSRPAPWVMVVGAEGRVARRALTVGLRGEGMVEVVQGVEESDLVVSEATARVEEGRRVRVKARPGVGP